MDLEGIDTAVLFGTSPFLSLPFVEDKDLASAVARVYNNWLAGYCKADPRRLKGVALTAIQDPVQAVKELRRAVEELEICRRSDAADFSIGKKSRSSRSVSVLRRSRAPQRARLYSRRRGRRRARGDGAFRSSVLHPCDGPPIRANDRDTLRGRRRSTGTLSAAEVRLHGSGLRLGALLDGAARRAL